MRPAFGRSQNDPCRVPQTICGGRREQLEEWRVRGFPTSAFITGNLALRLTLMARRQNSEGVQGPGTLTHRNLRIQPADPRSKTSKRRKESINSPTNSCQCFCVMDTPEIYEVAGPVVVSEFLTAIQASDVGPAMDGSASG
jgi:hypothetical protein